MLGMPEAATGGVLRNFTKFTGKQLCQGLFFNKVDTGVFLFFSKFIRTLLFTEHLRATASGMLKLNYVGWE